MKTKSTTALQSSKFSTSSLMLPAYSNLGIDVYLTGAICDSAITKLQLIFPVFLDSTKLKIVWIKITTML